MNKTELIKAVSDKTYYSQALVKEILYAAQDVVVENMADGEEVRISGFGKFCVKRRAARKYKGFDGKVRRRKETYIPCFVAWEGLKKKVKRAGNIRENFWSGAKYNR